MAEYEGMSTVGYFPDDEHIWVMTDSMYMKEEVENGLNRRTVRVHSLDTIINAFEQAPKKNGQPMASVIIFSELPEEIKYVMSEVKSIFEVTPSIKVYEIGRDKWMENSFEFGTLNALVTKSKGVSRSKYIKELEPTDKQKEVLESLEADLAIEKDKKGNKEKEIQALNNLVDELKRQNADLQAQIEYELLPSDKESKRQVDEFRVKLSEMEIELETERRKSYDYNEKNKDLNTQVMDSEYTISALKQKLEKNNSIIQSLQNELVQRDNELSEYNKRIQSMMSTVVDGEKYVQIEKNLQQEKIKTRTLEQQLTEAHIHIREKEIDTKELNDTIVAMRKGKLTGEILGRTLRLDHYRLKNTDLIYIKVINELPYHRLAVQMLFEDISDRYDNRAHMVIIKNDEGYDNKMFKGLPLYRDYTEVDVDTKQYRLHPHTTMFTGLDNFEINIDCLFVVDYIQNDDYLLESLARETVMTMVRYPDMLKDTDLDLRGNPLTIGSESIFDLGFDPRIHGSNLRKTRHDLLRHKVYQWTDRLNVRPRQNY